MEGLFESDKAKLKPPPKFLEGARFRGVGGGSPQPKADASPAVTGCGVRTAPISRSMIGQKTALAKQAGHVNPGESYASQHSQAAPASPLARGVPAGMAAAHNHNGVRGQSRDHSHDPHYDPHYHNDHGSTAQRSPMFRAPGGSRDDMHSLDEPSHTSIPRKVRGVSAKRKASGGLLHNTPAGGVPAGAKATIRAKSPGGATLRKGHKTPTSHDHPVTRGKSAPKKKLPSELEVAKGRVHELEVMLDDHRVEIEHLHGHIEALQQQYQEDREAVEREHQGELDQAAAAMEALRDEKDHEIAGLHARLAAAQREIEDEKARTRQVQEAADKQAQMDQRRIDSIADEANARIGEYEEVIEKFQQEIERLEGVVEARDQRIALIEHERDTRYQQYEECLMIGEKSRAELHNSLIELKGNIRVFARIRPLLKREVDAKLGDNTMNFEFPEGTDHRCLRVTNVPSHTSVVTGQSEGSKTLPFTFDKVFAPSTSQERVFDEISQLVQSSLDGYRVTIFAYGQTGSGKTYTMEGPDPTVEDDRTGMIARAVNQIFDNTQWKSRQTGFNFQLVCSFMEIYNETVADLLNPTDYGSQKLKHDIRIVDGEAVVSNIHEEVVESREHVYQLLKIANVNRSTAATKMNDRASRSHSVFQMKIRGYNEATRQSISGLLNLVDLAGSERLSKSQAEGDRLRETQHINKSLACLGDVIAALAKGDGSHIPFRQSKLTHLLQPSMTNESKTLMFVNINPVKDHLHESLCSLRFAAKVNACEIGLAKRKVKSKD